ncbi:hypothetical protein [Dongia sedimenti]|uniref:PEP-CTERM sorting domain-containing protein n=1 Tax=Dongia sedimenti TaxID=3064282 RepID=A0ABU0YKF4_9PROT|nr:hypothetical protein [Rhodospirillaceae bacterium R-7]
MVENPKDRELTMRRLAGIVVAFMFVLVLGGRGASALPIDLGTLTSGNAVAFSFSATATGLSSQEFTFTLTAPSVIVTTATNIMAPGIFEAVNFSMQLSGPGGFAVGILGGSPLVKVLNAFDILGSLAAPGSYTLLIDMYRDPAGPGAPAGLIAGSVVAASAPAVATTPIPGAVLMLLTGMGALGGLAWRRRRIAGPLS